MKTYAKMEIMLAFAIFLPLIFASTHSAAMGPYAPQANGDSQGGSVHPSATNVINARGVEVDSRLARVKNFEQLEAYLDSDDQTENPFLHLTEEGLKRFLDTLVFTEKGLASFDPLVLETELTPSQSYSLLSLFGLQRLAPYLDSSRVETDLDRKVRGLEGVMAPTDASTGESMDCPVLERARCRPPATCVSAVAAWCVTCNCGTIPPSPSVN